LGFQVRHLQWIPHTLSHAQELNRVSLSRELLAMLQRQEQRSQHDIVILDESWFCLNADPELIWLQSDEGIPERERHTSQ
jgi:hypothetical protein